MCECVCVHRCITYKAKWESEANHLSNSAPLVQQLQSCSSPTACQGTTQVLSHSQAHHPLCQGVDGQLRNRQKLLCTDVTLQAAI